MSLRQLKFKPKLQLNTAAKNKSDDNNSRPCIKVACNNKNVESGSSNPVIAEVLLVEVVKGENKTSELPELKDSSSASFSDCKESNICENVCKSVDTFSGSVVNDIDNESSSSNQGNATPIIPKVDLQVNGSVPSIGSADLLIDSQSGSSSSLITISSHPSKQLIQESEIQTISDSDINVDSSILGDSNGKAKSLINYDILKNLSSLGSQQINSQNLGRLNVVDKDSQELLLNDESKTTLNVSTEKVNGNKRSEQNRIVESEADDTCPVKVSNVLNKENLVSPRNNKPAVSSIKTNNGSKTTKRKKYEGKNTDSSPSKVNTHQRANFKPNVVALGKIRRPEKFATSSYSKMGTLAKEQFLKKFGKQQEPDASKLTMMDLIFYNPSTNPMPQSSDKKLLNTLNNSANAEKDEEKNGNMSLDKEKNEVNNSEETDENADDILPVPQLKISADGKVIVAQESLIIKPSNNLENCNFETVIDSELKKRKPVRNPNRCGWSHLDTIKFYKALNSLGCDFETMQSIFPDRSRKNLKSKFKKEEKLHGSLINKVLSRHSEFDLTNVVRELEIDTVYKDTIKTYGRSFTETEKRSKGRKKSLSSVVAGKSSKKNEDDESDDSISDEEFGKKKKKVDLQVLSKMSEVLGLNGNHNSSAQEGETKLSNSESSDTNNLKEPETTKRKRKKIREYMESDSDFERELEASVMKNGAEEKNTGNQSLRRTPRIISNRKKVKPPVERIQNKRLVLRLDELIDFNDGSVKEPQPTSQTEIINDNHIVINTNIEFENLKYTRYISYNSNNLENPVEINETVAHVD